jgi:uncharacterized protein involved in response to NO
LQTLEGYCSQHIAASPPIFAPQFDPAVYLRWIYLSAACWFACFGLLGLRYIPSLLRARVDGKEH